MRNPEREGGSNFLVALERLDNNAIYTSNLTLGDGDYTIQHLPPDTRVKLFPRWDCVSPPCRTQEGLDAIDLAIMMSHINRVKLMMCPFQRIAADMNLSGKIDLVDARWLEGMIINPNTMLQRFWRFVPRTYVDPAHAHLCPSFYRDFWTSELVNENGYEYPFVAIYHYKNVNEDDFFYNYQDQYYGSTPLDGHWIDTLNEWYLTNNNFDDNITWDFYAIRMGDLDGSGSQNAIAGQYKSSIEKTETRISDEKRLSRSSRFKVSVWIDRIDKVVGFQFGITYDPAKVRIMDKTAKSALFPTFNYEYNSYIDDREVRFVLVDDKFQHKTVQKPESVLEFEIELLDATNIDGVDIRELFEINSEYLKPMFVRRDLSIQVPRFSIQLE